MKKMSRKIFKSLIRLKKWRPMGKKMRFKRMLEARFGCSVTLLELSMGVEPMTSSLPRTVVIAHFY